MESIEITASSMEEALDKAATELGVEPSRVRLTVLEQTKGLFGQGKVRVKAEVGPEPEVVVAAPAPAPAPKAKAKAKAEPKPKSEPKAKPAPEPVAEPEPEPEVEEAPVVVAEETEEDQAESRPATEEDAEQLVGYINEILEAANFRASAECESITGKYINIELDGRDVSYLVGRRGEVLNAFQYLMNVIATRQLSGPRVVLDGNHYRERREEILTKLAVEIAEQVRERGEEAVLDALPAFERRVVHRALVDFDGVSTYSEGEEPNRRVVIAPAE